MKIGDLVRIRASSTWRYPRKEWCENQHAMVVVRSNGSTIMVAEENLTWMPKQYFMVVSKYENR